MPHPERSPLPHLSIQPRNFSTEATDWRHIADLVRLADASGVDRVVFSDHVVMGEQLDRYGDPKAGGTIGGRQPTGPDGHWLEPLTLIGTLVPVTERIRFGTSILIAALRPAAVLAKQLATLDVLSGGRIDLGVGVGWQREEYESCGLDFDRRGQLLDDTLHLLRRLWTERVVDHDDGRVLMNRVHSMPKPLQPDGIPILVAGRATPRTARRIATFGNGWIPWGDDIADPRPGIERMRNALDEAGRDPEDLHVQGSLPIVRTDDGVDLDATLAPVPDLVDTGIRDFRIQTALGADPEADAHLFEALVPAFRSLVGRTD